MREGARERDKDGEMNKNGKMDATGRVERRGEGRVGRGGGGGKEEKSPERSSAVHKCQIHGSAPSRRDFNGEQVYNRLGTWGCIGIPVLGDVPYCK